MLKAINSTHKMVDVKNFRELAQTVFQYYQEVSNRPSDKSFSFGFL
jgi:hypothetical protein